MLNVYSNKINRNCEGCGRRDFIKVGTLGISGGLGLADLLAARAETKESKSKKSVVWLWLGGGATHVETFDPKMNAPAEFRSITGETSTNLTGVTLGGNFTEMGKVSDKLAFVRSFKHGNSGHGGGTHWLMTGYDNRNIDNGGLPTRPSMGSIISKVRGANDPKSGIPTYVRLSGIAADGPAFLGAAYSPFDPNGDALNNMKLKLSSDQIEDRRFLLKKLDNFKKESDQSGLIEGLTAFERQAFDLIYGKSAEAFDLSKEDPKTVERYSSDLGKKLLTARRLCESGTGFVTVNYGGWDMHSNIKNGMNSRGPVVDHAVAAFVQDVHDRGLQDDILLVVTGEFGRTPRINKNGGRDHWSPLSTLALSGGGLNMGQVVGESSAKAEYPKTNPITPQDLMATIFHVLGIDPNVQFVNQGGRPIFMVEEGKPIKELI